jgi:single-strand DNA-binding protein
MLLPRRETVRHRGTARRRTSLADAVYRRTAMSQGNYIMLTGFVARDPELHVIKETRTAVAKVRVGSPSRYLNRATGEWADGDVSYFDVTCWRYLAMNVKASLHKGDRVTLQGKFRTRTWTDNENRPRTNMEIIADAVGHNLTSGWTIYNRAATNPSKVQEELERGELARGDADGEGGYASDYAELSGRPEAAGLPREGTQSLADDERAVHDEQAVHHEQAVEEEQEQRTDEPEFAVNAPF